MPLTICGAAEPETGYVCTEDRNHTGDHKACDDTGRVIKQWPQD